MIDQLTLNSIDDFKKLLAQTSDQDFDGHTNFNRLSPEQKLLWLSQSCQFFYERQ